MSDYKVPECLYVQTGDYVGLACSERDPYNPQSDHVFWVNLSGGPVTVDVRRSNFDTGTDGDPWSYDLPTGLSMTDRQVNDALVLTR